MNTNKPTIKSTKTHRNHSKGSDFFITNEARIDLADGTSFKGVVPDWQTDSYGGEVVFNTGMTGYVESLTDPSYAGQILMFTYPLIGNYGVRLQSAESDKIQVSGVIVGEAAMYWSHSGSDRSLLDWLKSQNIPILMGVDTRLLTMPLQVKRVPHNYDYSKEIYDGVLLSNGPGDPTDYHGTIKNTQRALKVGKPIFGICLGSQIMGLAAGAKTYKLKFGHRGHNQPCLETDTNRGYITSQNHGYAIDEKSLPKDWVVSFNNLND